MFLSSAFVRWDVLDRRSEFCVGGRIHGAMPNLGTCGIFAEIIVIIPVFYRSNGPGYKSTTAIWTDVIQDFFDTRRAKRTLVGTNPRLQ